MERRKVSRACLVGALVLSDFLAEHHHAGIPLHLLIDGLTQGLPDGNLPRKVKLVQFSIFFTLAAVARAVQAPNIVNKFMK